ncbi:hypothetical protein BW247_01035 [Acidihalobacter ferrooxydans]|uniref:DUF4142 domain-containing protein n=2 Tax=Acidihalobacter ferrooxydans TaxID=1765967 RepID=A0A1P8UDD8_9GAMM|nr:hypothetical protein BW247_01035 [Acidihalobacter ferrooxydans]
MFSLRRSHVARIAGAASLFACVALPLQAMAANTSAAKPVEPNVQSAQAQQSSPAQLQQQYIAVRRELMQIKAKAEHDDPALIKQSEQYRKELFAAMKKNGSDPQKMIESFNSMAAKLKDKTLPEAKRKALLGELRGLQMSFFAAEHKAMQEPALQATSKKLEEATLAAMRKTNSNTDKLIKEMQVLQGKLLKAQAGAAPTK